MDVILLERIERLGQMGDVVKVKPGFARNFLLPRKKALRATDENLAVFSAKRAELEASNLKRKGEAEAVAAKTEGTKVVLLRQAGETGQLFGSVSSRDISDALAAAGIKVDRTQVQLDRPIKTLGLHEIRVRLHPEVTISVTANVARSAEEAELQASGKSRAPAEAKAEPVAAPETFFEEIPEEMKAEGESEAAPQS
jgi:large subunit ribosomal protein L9